MAEVDYSNYSVEKRKHRLLLVCDNGDASVFEDTPSAQMDKARMQKLRGELSIVKELVGRWEKYFEAEDRREWEDKLSAVKNEIIEPTESDARPEPAAFQPVAGPEPAAFQPVAGPEPAAFASELMRRQAEAKRILRDIRKRRMEQKLSGIEGPTLRKRAKSTNSNHTPLGHVRTFPKRSYGVRGGGH